MNFVRSGLFPTGHVSLTWEHRLFLPSAEGSPEKRRACHAHHWNLLSLWPNTAGFSGHSPPFCLQGSFYITTTIFSVSIQHDSQAFHKPLCMGSPTQFSSKVISNPVPSIQKPKSAPLKSDCNLILNTLLPPVHSHSRQGRSFIKPADPAPLLTSHPDRDREHTRPHRSQKADKGAGSSAVTAPGTAAAASLGTRPVSDGLTSPSRGQRQEQGLLRPPWVGRPEGRHLGTHPVASSPEEGPPTPQLTSGMRCPRSSQAETHRPPQAILRGKRGPPQRGRGRDKSQQSPQTN